MARVSVRLTPRGGRDAVEGWDGEVLRVRVSAAPVNGGANEALVRLLAKSLGLPASRVTLVAGARSRLKLVDVAGTSGDEVRAALGG
ncbi:MAG TPA: DUF167 domain-containing protein [Steroidobacteraceae bacterium]|nr:DUF167 domain-containing protein [Steroidobacteraceae bacterium]